MANPDIQYFASSGTWVKPAGAICVDIVLKGGDGGNAMELDGESFGGEGGGHSAVHPGNQAASAAYASVAYNPRPSAAPAGSPGSLSVDSFAASDLPGTVEVEVGKGGRPGGRDGYALIVTHLADPPPPSVPPHDRMLHAHSHEHPDDPAAYPHEHVHSGPGHMGIEHSHPHRHASGEQR